MTSISELCVVRDGVGLARALKRTMMISEQNQDEDRMIALMTQSRK